MHRYEYTLMNALKGGRPIGVAELLSETGMKREELLWAVENLLHRNAVEAERTETESVELTAEGQSYIAEMMPEENLLKKASVGKLGISSLRTFRMFLTDMFVVCVLRSACSASALLHSPPHDSMCALAIISADSSPEMLILPGFER